MRFRLGPFDLTIGRKAADNTTVSYPPSGFVTNLPSSSWWPFGERFTGSWQRGVTVPVTDGLQNPTFWSCTTLIASDISKCGFYLCQEDGNDIYQDVQSPAFSPVLRAPNHYQNQQQFIEQWVLSKLCYGNTIALKGRDGKNVVDSLYILDWTRCRPLLSPRGQVFYSLTSDQLAFEAIDDLRLAGAPSDGASIVVPASEVIHDRWNCLYHPLVGLGPIYAAGALTSQGLQIIANASSLAKAGFRPGGIVTAPEPISEENAKKYEQYWMDNFSGPDNAGRIIVLSGGLKYEKPPQNTAVESEIIKQLGWGVEQICATFHMPAYKVTGTAPGAADTAALTLQYYQQCLQVLATAVEACLGGGIGAIAAGYEVAFDEDELMRMDAGARMKFVTDGVKGGIFAPNEGRAKFNYGPLAGGDTVYLQEQDHSLAALAKRDAGPDPFGTAKAPAPKPPPAVPPAPPPAKYLSEDEIFGATERQKELMYV